MGKSVLVFLTNMHAVAKNSLLKNIIELKSGPYLAAGGHQFRSLWTRDFCFSVDSLIEIGRIDVAINHLNLLLKHRRATDGLVARVFDNIQPRARVVANCMFPQQVTQIMSKTLVKPLGDRLRPEYVDEHKTEAIDSNLLAILAAFKILRTTRDQKWFDAIQPDLEHLYQYYQRRRRGTHGPILQTPFSDWQDSRERSGYTLYTNILLYRVLKEARELAVLKVTALEPENFRAQTAAEFYWPELKLWRGRLTTDSKITDEVGLDYHLFGLESGFFGNESNELYQNIKNSELWLKSQNQLPGFVTFQKFSANQKSFAVRFAGLSRYHEDLYWSWLIKLAAKVAKQYGDVDESARILSALHKLYERDQYVFEIYDPKNMMPFRARFYESEYPFSWGC